jgi:hypothetical protein
MTLRLIRGRRQSETEASGENQTGLPPCEFTLQTEKGMTVYLRLARELTDSGRLDCATHLRLSRYALAADTMHDHQGRGLPLRASLFDQLRRAERDLGLHELGQTSVAPQPVHENKWARCGFASRARERS